MNKCKIQPGFLIQSMIWEYPKNSLRDSDRVINRSNKRLHFFHSDEIGRIQDGMAVDFFSLWKYISVLID
jgi:hypothetical protein